MARRPRIALNCDTVEDGERARAFLYLPYLDFVVRAGGLPVLIPAVDGSEEILADCDGVLFTGGDDYLISCDAEPHPARFVAVVERREASDLALAREAERLDLPSLGICLGFQLQVLVAGGEIHGDLESDRPEATGHRRLQADGPLPRHDVEWEAMPLVYTAAGVYSVNTQHHQAVSRLPGSWQSVARTCDGVIEAAMGPGTFQLGVQWHPERDLDAALSQRLGQALISAASDRAARDRAASDKAATVRATTDLAARERAARE